MRDPKFPPTLVALEDDYDIVGELGSGGRSRAFVATRKDAASKRKDDELGVLIEVVTPPEADEANALSHLAADTQLLLRLRHRRLIPVLDGRWINPDAFAVVTQRIADPSLAQMLEKGEAFSNPRAAAILREINGLLEWAREQKIVHRNVTADRIRLEPKTDRVRVSFAVAPIPRLQASEDADVDARTIGRLAVAMLTGHDEIGGNPGALEELRPDLPAQLIQATATLLGGATGTDVPAYIALIGMAEPLFTGESEAARIRAEILAEQEAERAKIASERAEFEAAMALERQALATERAELQRAVADERAALQQAVTDERAALVAKQEELEQAVAERRAELERAAEEDRERIATLRAEIERAGEHEVEKKRAAALDDIAVTQSALDDGELATPPLALPVGAPLQPLTFESLTFVEEPLPEPVDETTDAGPRRRKWILRGALGAAAVAIIAVLVIAGRATTATPVATPAATAAAPPPASAPTAVVPLPVPATPDSSVVDSASSRDSLGVAVPAVRRQSRAVVRETDTPRDLPRDTPRVTPRDTASVVDILSRVPGAAPVPPPTPPS